MSIRLIHNYVKNRDYLRAKQEIQKFLKTTEIDSIKFFSSFLSYKLGDYGQSIREFAELQHIRTGNNISDNWVAFLSRKKNVKNKFVGFYDRLPIALNKRLAEGGSRLSGLKKKSLPESPLVSVVTVVYNNKDTLQRCINSIANQTYGNIEYIIIDGGSKDGTIDVIKDNESIIDYYVSEPDAGIYAAMNKGISCCKGDYICLLNSDDFYQKEHIKNCIDKVIDLNFEVDVVFTDYMAAGKRLNSNGFNEGIYFGHLNICHNTFLVSSSCYDEIGPYREDFKIVSDAVWMRKAFNAGVRFAHIREASFTLSEGGLSSGGSEAHRKLFISEVVRSYCEIFPELDIADAEEVYLFRFNKSRTINLLKIVKKYANNKLITSSLRNYVEYCFLNRPNFLLTQADSDKLFIDYLELVDFLGISDRVIPLSTKSGMYSEIILKIEKICSLKKKAAKKTILHFVSVFSAPSETFIYDLICNLDHSSVYDNFVLYEHPKLREERPYQKSLQIYWSDFKESVAIRIYKVILKLLEPDVVIAHFILNAEKWDLRTKFLNYTLPIISVCHGIDAFSMRTNSNYKNYVVNDFCNRSNTVITAVSDYLKKELLANGVPERKVRVIGNSVSDSFYKNRKKNNFYDYKRELKILSVGRLIQLKGHEFLIRALFEFKKECTFNFHLTIVYGGGSDLLENLRNVVSELDLESNVSFESYIDFNKNPDYFSNFDLFIHPSTYSSDDFNRSETFGVSVLEAISAGLPVIVTDAGGVHEVVGAECDFCRIVEHGNSHAIFKALKSIWETKKSFSDNDFFATERLNKFGRESQIKKYSDLIEDLTKPIVKAALFSTSTIQGAGYAAYRLHKGFRSTRVKSRLFTTVRNHENEFDVAVIKHPSGDNSKWNSDQIKPKPGFTISTINQNHIDNLQLGKMVEHFDIVNIHWSARFLSVENIAFLTNLDKPIVITIRDMLPITGGCHFFHGCTNWQTNCAGCPQLGDQIAEGPMKIIEYKRSQYNFKNITIVTLSKHTKSLVEKAPFFKDCRIELIPNSIETDVFRPYDRNARRKEFGLPLERVIIGYVPSFSSEVKGYKELISALRMLKDKYPDIDPLILLMGNQTPASEEINFDKKILGYISDNKRLAWAYSSCDVVVVPSLEETFSNTTAEAISCGVPVVGFRTGAIPDLVINNKTGICCEVGNVSELCDGLVKVIKGKSMRRQCRIHAEEYLAFYKQAESYESLFNELLLNHKRG